MNQESIGNGIRGANIKPSARKGIHSHCVKCNSSSNRIMGRYGAIQRRSELSVPTAHNHKGQDEVDNVMSKMARPESPVLIRNDRRMCRRNSLDVNNDVTEDDTEDDSVLSKSSPPAFSPYSEYGSATATFLQHELPNNRNVSRSPESDRQINSSNRQNNSLSQYSSNKKESQSFVIKIKNLLALLIPIIIAVIAIRYYLSKSKEMSNNYDKISFYNDIMDLGEKYKIKDTSILQVRTGVSTIFEKQDTGSFVFAYNSKTHNFNTAMFNRFVEDIAVTASRYLRNDSAHHNTVIVDTVNLKVQTEKEFMDEYEAGVVETGVMLVRDVDKVPPHLAMAFHYYCDEFSPLVKRSAIFFTLNLARCSNNSDPRSTHEYIEKCLAKKWSNVGEDRIGPLLTRVVNIVVDVTSVV